MGDRANVLVKEDDKDSGVYLYTHWHGSDLPNILQDALKKKWRWNDSPYLTRIIFCEMVKNNIDGETGYGISTFLCDNEYPILELNVKKQTIKAGKLEYKFGEFINLDLKNFWLLAKGYEVSEETDEDEE